MRIILFLLSVLPCLGCAQAIPYMGEKLARNSWRPSAGFDAGALFRGLLPGKFPDYGLGEAHRGGARNENGLCFG